MGWIHYDVVITPPNTITDLTNAQLIVIGNQFNSDVNAYRAYINVLSDPEFAGIENVKFHVDWVYELMYRIQQYSILLMNGEYVTSTEPLTYNTPPVDQTDLNNQLDGIDDPYLNELNLTKINWAVARMIDYSKADGTGTWTYYEAEVTS